MREDYPAEYRKNIEEIFAMAYEAGSYRKLRALIRGGSFKMCPHILRRRQRRILRDVALVAVAIILLLAILSVADFFQYRHSTTTTATTESMPLDLLEQNKSKIEQKLREGGTQNIPLDKQQELQRILGKMY